MAKKVIYENLENEESSQEIQEVKEAPKVKVIKNEDIIECFEYLISQLNDLEKYKKSINKPYRVAFYLKTQLNILLTSFQRSQK
jgi:hypothetical protein